MPEATISAPAQTSAPAAAPSSSPSAPASPSGAAAPSKSSGPSPRLPASNPEPSKPYNISFDDAPVNTDTDSDTDAQSNQPAAGNQPPAQPGTSPQAKPGEAAPVGTPTAIPDKVKPLREAYESAKTKAAQLEARVAEYEAKIKAFETSPQGESKVLAEKLTAAEQRAQEYESRLREIDYERSDEYRQQFIKPIEENYAKLTRAMESWDVNETDGTVRPATEGDFQALMTMTDRQAKQVARERFGADAPEVLSLRASLVDATQKRQEAVKSFKANSEARQKDQVAKQAQAKQAMAQYWENTNKALVEKSPDLFGEGQDADENTALKEGLGIWDKAYGPGDVPPQVRIAHQALVRQSVGATSKLLVRNGKLTAQLKAANDELAKYRVSEPGRGDIHHADGKPNRNGYKTIDQAFAEP